MDQHKAIEVATFLLAQKLGIEDPERKKPGDIPDDTVIDDPAAFKVKVDMTGRCELQLPFCDFLEGTTWGAILESNGFGDLGKPIADYSPDS